MKATELSVSPKDQWRKIPISRIDGSVLYFHPTAQIDLNVSPT